MTAGKIELMAKTDALTPLRAALVTRKGIDSAVARKVLAAHSVKGTFEALGAKVWAEMPGLRVDMTGVSPENADTAVNAIAPFAVGGSNLTWHNGDNLISAVFHDGKVSRTVGQKKCSWSATAFTVSSEEGRKVLDVFVAEFHADGFEPELLGHKGQSARFVFENGKLLEMTVPSDMYDAIWPFMLWLHQASSNDEATFDNAVKAAKSFGWTKTVQTPEFWTEQRPA